MKKGKAIKKVMLELKGHKMKLRDGITTVVFEFAKPTKRSPVYVLSADDEYINAPEGTLELVDGKTAIVDANSKLEVIVKDSNVEGYLKVKETGKPSKETFLSKLKLHLKH